MTTTTSTTTTAAEILKGITPAFAVALLTGVSLYTVISEEKPAKRGMAATEAYAHAVFHRFTDPGYWKAPYSVAMTGTALERQAACAVLEAVNTFYMGDDAKATHGEMGSEFRSNGYQCW